MSCIFIAVHTNGERDEGGSVLIVKGFMPSQHSLHFMYCLLTLAVAAVAIYINGSSKEMSQQPLGGDERIANLKCGREIKMQTPRFVEN